MMGQKMGKRQRKERKATKTSQNWDEPESLSWEGHQGTALLGVGSEPAFAGHGVLPPRRAYESVWRARACKGRKKNFQVSTSCNSNSAALPNALPNLSRTLLMDRIIHYSLLIVKFPGGWFQS